MRLEFYDGLRDPWSTVQSWKKIYGFVFMLGLNETIDKLATAMAVFVGMAMC